MQLYICSSTKLEINKLYCWCPISDGFFPQGYSFDEGKYFYYSSFVE